MNWFASRSLKAKILLSILGLFVFAALVPTENPTTTSPPKSQLVSETEESSLLEDQDIEEEEKTEEKTGEEKTSDTGAVASSTTTSTQPEPQPNPTPKPKPEPAPEPTPDCDPSYTNVCIPVGSADYDCAGGSGNGPNYISGPVYVRHDVANPDPHGLDRDKDGVGCENQTSMPKLKVGKAVGEFERV